MPLIDHMDTGIKKTLGRNQITSAKSFLVVTFQRDREMTVISDCLTLGQVDEIIVRLSKMRGQTVAGEKAGFK